MVSHRNNRAAELRRVNRSGLTQFLQTISLVAAVLLMSVLMFLPGCMFRSHSTSPKSGCKANLKHIGLALHNYHDVYGTFPPAYVADEEGKPLYSWRVLLLPYLDCSIVYEDFHLDEPWDSSHNLPLLDRVIPSFECPVSSEIRSDGDEATGMTDYLAVIGPGTLWPAPKACQIDDVIDGLSQTVAVVEVANSGIHWAEPRDLHVTQMSPVVNPKAGMGLSSRHRGGMHVLFGDGHVQFIADETQPETIRALLSRAGGEDVGGDF